MGRRKGSVNKKIEGPQMLDHPSSVKDQPDSTIPSLEKTTLSPELTTELIKVSTVGNKILKNKKATPRRSPRNQNVPTSSRDQDIEPVIENIEASESEEDNPCSYKEKISPKRISGVETMEKKIDHLILLLEQGRTGEASLSQGCERCFPTQNPCLAEIKSGMKKTKYKNMYIDSQKKIEELRNENFELSKKLETVVGKLEGYEKGQLVYSEAIDKFKDTFFISSLTKTADMVSGLALPRAIKRRRLTKGEARSPAGGRKKVAKGSKDGNSSIPSR